MLKQAIHYRNWNWQNKKISLLTANVIREQGKFTTSVHRKPTFNGLFTHFDSFLPNTYKIGMIYSFKMLLNML